MSPRMFSAARGARAGFTLAEVLVAAMLLSIVMTAVYTLFHSALGAWRGVEGGFDAHLEARSFMTLFGHEYGNLMYQAGHLFEGKDDEIVLFVITQPVNLEEGESRRLMRVEYTYRRGRGEIFREEAFVDAALPKQPPEGQEMDRTRIKLRDKHRTVVAKNVTDFEISYVWMPIEEGRDLNLPPNPEPPIYMDRHEEGWWLPNGVEITLEVSDPDEKQPPYRITSIFPTRAPSGGRSRLMLEQMFDKGKDRR